MTTQHRREAGKWTSQLSKIGPRRQYALPRKHAVSHSARPFNTTSPTIKAPLRGWAPRGHRLKGYAPHGRWRTLTFLAGLRRDGPSAACVFDGPINQRSFQAWVEQQRVPTLRTGDLVILDNLASHKGKAVRRAIRRAGARPGFLPPYSADLNPIEQAFAKIKHWMRDAQKRTVDDVWQHLGALIATIEPRECQNYIRNAGYRST